MSDLNDDRLPPLGEPTPPSRRNGVGTPWHKRPWVAGLAGITVGLMLGLGLAAVADNGSNGAAVVSEPVETTLPQRTTTTIRALPRECADAMRTAEQSLTLLEQAFQSARRFDVGQLDRMLAELEDVRGRLTDRVRTCVEGA